MTFKKIFISSISIISFLNIAVFAEEQWTNHSRTTTTDASSYSVTETSTTAPVTTIPEITTTVPATITSVPVTTVPETTTSVPMTTTSVELAPAGPVNGEMMQNIGCYDVELPENPNYRGTKSYEPYDTITAPSIQLLLQGIAETDVDGFRKINNRYLVAVGTGFGAQCGSFIDLILENGVTIPCVVGDIKADAHTDEETHMYTRSTMCASEFIVDTKLSPATTLGNISYVYPEWNSKVKSVRVYLLVITF